MQYLFSLNRRGLRAPSVFLCKDRAVAGDDEMDVPAVLDGLNKALAMQHRSALQYTLSSGSIFGFEYQALGDRLWVFAAAELADARLLVEKVAALGGAPTTDVAPMTWSGDAAQVVEWLIETESEAIDALQEVIPPTGNEGRSEALEHLLEHIIMRKQNQVDWPRRAQRTA